LTEVALDTSVIIEYIDRKGAFHEQAETVITACSTGELKAVLPHPILAETYYVTARLYHKLKVEEPHVQALNLIEWLVRLPTTILPSQTIELAVETGKTKLDYRLALTDCYVLAASKIHSCKALFKKPEREMLETIDTLRKKYQILFLEDYK
jgi:predicted nucleic acid-binding protein